MVTYEYKVEEISGIDYASMANELAKEGWELVSTERSSKRYSLYSVPLYGPSRYRTTILNFRRSVAVQEKT